MPNLVSESALIRRINRRLACDGEKLGKSHRREVWSGIGRYQVVSNNVIICHFDDLEAWARKEVPSAIHTRERLAE